MPDEQHKIFETIEAQFVNLKDLLEQGYISENQYDEHCNKLYSVLNSISEPKSEL